MRILALEPRETLAERLGPSLGTQVPPGQRGPGRTLAPVLPDVAEEDDLEGYGAGHWVVVVYDNDYNTFDEVIAILLIATRCSLREAQIETWEVHHLGKSVVHFGSEEECKRVAAVISSIGIRVEVREE